MARPSRTDSLRKSSVIINVYDLLPPGKLTSVAWYMGCPLLHTGVVIRDREYAFGGHDRPGLTGVYYTRPRTERAGATFRCEILHGFTMATDDELEKMVRKASNLFLGTAYNLLTKNCNHFTSYLCEILTGQPAPAYLNRAAGIGVALPCIVPQEWIEPPDCEDLSDEEAALVEDEYERTYTIGDASDEERFRRDTAGRELPVAERAPLKN